MKIILRFTLTLWLMVAVLLCGCATQRTELEETSPDGSRKSSKTITRTFWDSKSELAKLKTSHTKATQSIGITGLDQESTSTNVVDLVERVVGAAVKAGVRGAIP